MLVSCYVKSMCMSMFLFCCLSLLLLQRTIKLLLKKTLLTLHTRIYYKIHGKYIIFLKMAVSNELTLYLRANKKQIHKLRTNEMKTTTTTCNNKSIYIFSSCIWLDIFVTMTAKTKYTQSRSSII